MRQIGGRLRRRSIRSWFLSGSLLLVVSVAAAMLAVVYGQERAAARSVARTELKEASRRSVYRVEQLLAAAEMTCESAARAMGGVAAGPDAWEGIFVRLVTAFEQRPELTYLGFSLAQTGEAAFLRRNPDGTMEWLVYRDATQGVRTIRRYRYHAGRFAELREDPWDGYDPRHRPFFELARTTRKPGWTGIYAFSDPEGRPPILGVTYVLPVFSSSGELTGVWDADLDTDALCSFLRVVGAETGAESFIIEARGGGRQWLVGHPRPERVGRAEVPAMTEAAWMAAEAAQLFPGAGRGWLGESASLRPPRPAWTVVTLSGASPAAAAFARQQRWLIGLVALGAVALAVAGSVGLARFMARPVEDLRAAVSDLASGNRRSLRLLAAPRELLDLSAAFRDMEASISRREAELREANRSLEEEIQRRIEHEALLDAVVSQVPFDLTVWDDEGHCVLQNPGSLQRAGELAGVPLAQAADLLEIPDLPEIFGRVRGGGVVRKENVVTRPGGCEFTHLVFVPVRAGGRTSGVVCVGIDVTEQRRAEEALRSSQRRLSLHLENTPLGVIDWNPDFTVAAWNPAAELIFGWTAAEAIGRHASFIIPEAERSGVEASWRDLLQRRGAARYSNQNLSRNGRLIECEWYSTVVGDADGAIASVSSLVLDVTERASAERMFRESEERFHKAFRRAPIPQAIARLDDCAIIDVNDRWEVCFGIPRGHAIGRTAAELGLWPDPAMRDTVLGELQSSGEIHDREVRLVRADGSAGDFLLSVTMVNLQTSAIMVISQVDITDRQRAAQEIRALNEHLERRVAERTRELETANTRLQELDRLKSEFLATMSHELRTPLNSIIGFSSILRQGMAGPLNDEQAKQITMVHGSARHLLDLINDLLDVSRIEAGRVELFHEPFGVAEVIHDVERTLAPMTAARHLSFAAEISPTLPPIVSDRKRVYQIVLNLANNAVKFTESGGVRIVAAAVGSDAISIAVHDTGIGIRPENLPRLFEAFRQVDGSARRVYEGTGLGLFLVRKLLNLLGGRIEVSSEFGRGSTFTIILPLSAPAGHLPTPAPSLWQTRKNPA